MYEYNYYKSINIESGNLKLSKELTKNCIIEVKEKFERLFSDIKGFSFSSSIDKNNVFIFTVTNNNFNAKLKLEITNDICYEEKYLSLYISSFAGAFSLERIKKISKEIKFWFIFSGFFLGTILAFPIAYWGCPNPGKTAFSGRGIAFIVFLVFFSFGFIFLKTGNLIGKLITNYEKNILNKNTDFQRKLEIWEKFINKIQMFFEEKYYKLKKENEGENNKELIFGQYETIKNFKKISEALTKYLEYKDSDSFIIFENKHANNLLQIYRNKENHLTLNFSMQFLKSLEYERAIKYLNEIIRIGKNKEVLEETKEYLLNNEAEIYMDLPENINFISNVILGFFLEVNKLRRNFKLKITKGSF